MVLQSTGTSTRWVATSSLGILGGSGADGVSNWLLSGGALRPSTTVGIVVAASSTIGGGSAATGLTIAGNATTTGNLILTPVNNNQWVGNSANNGIRFDGTGNYGAVLNSTVGSAIILDSDANTGSVTRFFVGKDNVDPDSATQLLTVLDTGNVGIATSSPDTALSVVGTTTSTNLDVTTGLRFNGVTGTTWSAFCVAITGSASLCDGSDDGAGGGTVYLATTSTWTTGDIARVASNGTVSSIATSSLGLSPLFTTSATLAALLSDETGTGFAVFNANPSFTGTSTFEVLLASSSVGIGTTNPSDGRLQVANSTTANGIHLVQAADVGTNIATDGALFINNTSNPGNGLTIYSDMNATQSGVLAQITADNTAYDRDVLAVRNDGTGINTYIDQNGGGRALFIDHDDTGTGRSLEIDRDGNNASAITGLHVNVANIGAGGAYAAIFEAGNVGIGTTSPTARLGVVGASSGVIMQLVSDAGTKFMEMLNTGVTVLLGAWDFGGADSLEIPNGTNPTTDATGEIALDTTDNQLIVDNGTTDMVYRGEDVIVKFTLASTSPEFRNGGVVPIPLEKDGFVLTQYRCYVTGGTSVVVNLSDGTNDTETITCNTTASSDTDVATNDTFTADELARVEIGAVTGAVNYLSFTAYGFWVRE
jgi:hypothetical protein